jgi:hypothetical protein
MKVGAGQLNSRHDDACVVHDHANEDASCNNLSKVATLAKRTKRPRVEADGKVVLRGSR